MAGTPVRPGGGRPTGGKGGRTTSSGKTKDAAAPESARKVVAEDLGLGADGAINVINRAARDAQSLQAVRTKYATRDLSTEAEAAAQFFTAYDGKQHPFVIELTDGMVGKLNRHFLVTEGYVEKDGVKTLQNVVIPLVLDGTPGLPVKREFMRAATRMKAEGIVMPEFDMNAFYPTNLKKMENAIAHARDLGWAEANLQTKSSRPDITNLKAIAAKPANTGEPETFPFYASSRAASPEDAGASHVLWGNVTLRDNLHGGWEMVSAEGSPHTFVGAIPMGQEKPTAHQRAKVMKLVERIGELNGQNPVKLPWHGYRQHALSFDETVGWLQREVEHLEKTKGTSATLATQKTAWQRGEEKTFDGAYTTGGKKKEPWRYRIDTDPNGAPGKKKRLMAHAFVEQNGVKDYFEVPFPLDIPGGDAYVSQADAVALMHGIVLLNKARLPLPPIQDKLGYFEVYNAINEALVNHRKGQSKATIAAEMKVTEEQLLDGAAMQAEKARLSSLGKWLSLEGKRVSPATGWSYDLQVSNDNGRSLEYRIVSDYFTGPLPANHERRIGRPDARDVEDMLGLVAKLGKITKKTVDLDEVFARFTSTPEQLNTYQVKNDLEIAIKTANADKKLADEQQPSKDAKKKPTMKPNPRRTSDAGTLDFASLDLSGVSAASMAVAHADTVRAPSVPAAQGQLDASVYLG